MHKIYESPLLDMLDKSIERSGLSGVAVYVEKNDGFATVGFAMATEGDARKMAAMLRRTGKYQEVTVRDGGDVWQVTGDISLAVLAG